MKKSLELMSKSSALREQLNEFLKLESPTSEQVQEAESRSQELADVEKAFRVALAQEDRDELAATRDAPEKREYETLIQTAQLSTFLIASLEQRSLPGEGAEFELAQELGLAAGDIPLDLLAPPLEQERRADAVTPAPSTADTATNVAGIAGRVFANTVSRQYLGVMFPTVGIGTAAYPYLKTGSKAAAPIADDATVDSTAGEFAVEKLEPTRISSRVSFRGRDLQLLAGMEQALRTDLNRAFVDAVDAQIIRGTGTAPEFSGFVGTPTPAIADPTNSITNVVDFAASQSNILDAMEGLWAKSYDQLSVVCTPAFQNFLAALYRSDESSDVAWDALRDRIGNVISSANMPAAAANVEQVLIHRSGGGVPLSWAPVWQAMQATRDDVTGAAQDRIFITLKGYSSFGVARSDGYTRRRFKVA